ncbi:hypothetical protein WICMUC_005271 [Wickerhamomyces mucosus]|uniref:Enhancer of mRNA-decapping protein 3 n=1 Tax=Wickerhamomyces mucosus TaxID=1378264 RepID=A0A9P8PAK3_9ASCO|nr:hypothetical protein WICMUC_005271 [Wickerhamomyces mucosus]
MALPVVGYGVAITLNSGDTVRGKVAKVADKVLTLEKVHFDDGSRSRFYEAAGSEITDIKVTELPNDLLNSKNKRKERKNRNVSNNNYSNSSNFGSPGPTNDHSSRPQDKTPKVKILKRRENNGDNFYHDKNIVWSAGDVSHIKHGGDFDFEGSTAAFDKSSALEEFAQNDRIDLSQRLVSSNKLKSPLKTKYDNDENVLPNQRDGWDKDNNTRTIEKQFSSLKIRSPSLDIKGFLLTSIRKEQLPLASPIQLLEIERLSSENFKISPRLIAENASRSMINIIIKILGGSTRIDESNHNLPPLILLLAGNNRAGSRALAAGRQLTNSGIRVVAFTLIDHTSTDDFEEQVAEQLNLFKLAGGKCVSNLRDLKKVIKSIETPIELIIDALQGYDTSIIDLWGDELQAAKSIIQWTNQQGVKTLSLDIPSGIDAGSGLISEIAPIDSKFVLSLGLPLNGILQAYSNSIVSRGDWAHYLVDIGLPSKLFKKGNLRKFDRSWFAGDAVVPLEITES